MNQIGPQSMSVCGFSADVSLFGGGLHPEIKVKTVVAAAGHLHDYAPETDSKPRSWYPISKILV